MKTVFTLHLGAQGGTRPPLETVRDAARRCFDSFALIPGEGWFRGTYDPGWNLKIATNDLAAITDLATRLRRQFSQNGVGIEVHGVYLRCTANCEGAALARELGDALWAGTPAGHQEPPGHWHLLGGDRRDDLGGARDLRNYLRALSDERFSWGQDPAKDSEETEIEVVESGPSGWIAQVLAQQGYAAADLDTLVAQEPRFAPLREAFASLPL